MNDFCQSFHCTSRAHCRACRTRPEWRAKVGAPNECPHGITEWNLPSRGLGDTVAKAIHTATLGLVKPCAACRRRQATLNQALPYQEN